MIADKLKLSAKICVNQRNLREIKSVKEHLNEMNRCAWAKSELEIVYHDREWGVPCYDDRRLFEFLILETMQAGLSWAVVLSKREAIRAAFDNFDPEKLAVYDERKVNSLLQNERIIRNRAKIESAIKNAQAFLRVVESFGSFADYVWSFVNRKPIKNSWQNLSQIPSFTPVAERMSDDMKLRSFSFVGPTVCYAFMQACGLVNDHLVSCFRYNEINQKQGAKL